MFGRSKTVQKQKPKPRPKRKNITYRINPMNYLILSEQEKALVLRAFAGIVSSIENRLKITIVNQRTHTQYAGTGYDYTEKIAYFTSKQDMGASLMGTGFKSTRLDEPIEFPIESEESGHLVMENGVLLKMYVVHNFPRTIQPTWINQLSAICDIINVEINTTKPNLAKRSLISHANTLESRAGRRRQQEAEEARYVVDLIEKQETVMYECGITVAVSATDRKSLRKRAREFEKAARMKQIHCLSVSGKQRDTLDGWGPRFQVEGSSIAMFYPFESSDLIEADGAGGVYIGMNEFTGTPVIYDYLRRTNYNMTVLGASGYGKSITAKTYIDNFHAMMRDKYGDSPVMAYILDLHGEYVELADHLNMNVMDLMRRDQMGLDPFALLSTSDEAIDILTSVVEMPKDLKSLVLSKAENVKSVHAMVDILRNDKTPDAEDCRRAATYLMQFVEGDLSKMFRGDLHVDDRTIIALRKAQKNSINSMLISLTLQKIWLDVRNAPKHVPKLLVIEEAWFVLNMPSTAAILSDIAKSGRKENLHLIVMTQDIDEMLANEHGRSVIKNSATVFLLGLKAATAKTLQEVLDLSDKERDEIVYLDKGQAIIRADSNRIKLKVKPTKEQLELFNTAATGLVPTGPDA